MQARKPRAISTGLVALGLVGRCGQSPATSARTLRSAKKPKKVACPAWALSFCGVGRIRMILEPVLSLIASVTVW